MSNIEYIPFVTIGLPVFNCESFIEFAMMSILNQTFTNFEIIITDDGSTDRTLDILRGFNDSRIKIITDGENRGISFRLNQQIDMAKGKYFCRMDGDDIMFPDRLEHQIAFLESHKEIDVVGSSAIIIDDNNEIIGTRGYIENGLDKPCNSFIHPTVCGRIDYFRKYRYTDSLKGVEDADLWIRSNKESNFVQLNLPTLFYRDPLNFKLRVYLFRQRQYRIALHNWYKRNLIFTISYIKAFIYVYIKSLFAISLNVIGFDRYMIERRNAKCSESNSVYYSEILEDLLKINNVH